MNTGTAPAPKAPKNQGLTEAEADLKSEAMAIEKLRVQLSAQGAAADKKQVAEFAKRQKAYLDRKIDFEKLRRSTDSGKPVPAKAKPAAPEPVQKQKTQPEKPAPEKPAPAASEKTPPAEPPKPKTSRTKAPARPAQKPAARWMWWLLLAAAAGLVAWLMR